LLLGQEGRKPMETTESKKELLKSKVLTLVQNFMSSEGGITIRDLEALFGQPSGIENCHEVASALASKTIFYSV
jgi:hypothetical protein